MARWRVPRGTGGRLASPGRRREADVTRRAGLSGHLQGRPELVLSHEGAEREAYVQELKNVLFRYLGPVIDAGTVIPGR
ncbi:MULTISPECIES: hypothetical protein [Streptomyces]|uniref:hypothetical protein n=1 Tax=Streptomyces TaxID=1883 RepID=UPI00359F9F46